MNSSSEPILIHTKTSHPVSRKIWYKGNGSFSSSNKEQKAG